MISPTHTSVADESSDLDLEKSLRFEKEIFTAFDAFKTDVAFGILQLSKLGLTEEALAAWVRYFFSKAKAQGVEFNWIEVLSGISCLESEQLKSLLFNISVYESMTSTDQVSSVINFLAQNYPGGLSAASSFLWNNNEEKALELLPTLEPVDAEYFLLGSLAVNKSLSSKSLDVIIPNIRNMAGFDVKTKNDFEAHFLSQNIKGNCSSIERHLRTSNSEVVRNRIIPLLAKEKFNGDLEKAIEWAFDFEGGLNTQPVQELRDQKENIFNE